jgi:hypothetical protein
VSASAYCTLSSGRSANAGRKQSRHWPASPQSSPDASGTTPSALLPRAFACSARASAARAAQSSAPPPCARQRRSMISPARQHAGVKSGTGSGHTTSPVAPRASGRQARYSSELPWPE